MYESIYFINYNLNYSDLYVEYFETVVLPASTSIFIYLFVLILLDTCM